MTVAELERYQPEAQGVAVVPTDPTGGRLVAWAEGLEAAHRLGMALCQTSFVPNHFRGKAEETAAAILFGDEVGLSPTQAVQSIYVVQGTPALKARAMVALVMAHGHEIWTEEDTQARVTVSGRRRGSNRVETVTWTTDRARKAGYTRNQRYEQDPQGMLYARASGDVARRVAPDVLAGVAYTVEEMELESGSTVTVKRKATEEPKRTAKRAPLPVREAEEPELEDANPWITPTTKPEEPEAGPAQELSQTTLDLPDDDTSTEGPETITRPQMRMLQASFRAAGITGKAERHAYAAGVIGRDVAGSEELTKEEASQVIDALSADAPQGPDQ